MHRPLDAECAPSTTVTQGNRQQPLLRALISILKKNGVEQLQRSDLDFLLSVHTLAHRLEQVDVFKRFADILDQSLERIQSQTRALPTVVGLGGIASRLHITCAKAIKSARSREVQLFAGLKISGRGPVYTHKGDLKVIDHVPDDCMLVVEEGGCTVGGYVLGKLAVASYCEVRENIAGTVISREGTICARTLRS